MRKYRATSRAWAYSNVLQLVTLLPSAVVFARLSALRNRRYRFWISVLGTRVRTRTRTHIHSN